MLFYPNLKLSVRMKLSIFAILKECVYNGKKRTKTQNCFNF